MLDKNSGLRMVNVVTTKRSVSDTFPDVSCEDCKNSGKGFWAKTPQGQRAKGAD